jgi:hemerythrin
VILVRSQHQNNLGLGGQQRSDEVALFCNRDLLQPCTFQEPKMSLLEWNESYSVKVTSFDQQHQTLFKSINELHEALRAGRGKDLVGKILQRLIDYTASHFAKEEAVLEKNGYPELATHRAGHRALVNEVLKLQKDYEAGNLGVAVKLMQFLQKWLSDHIQNTDKRYGSFLNEKGIH